MRDGGAARRSFAVTRSPAVARYLAPVRKRYSRPRSSEPRLAALPAGHATARRGGRPAERLFSSRRTSPRQIPDPLPDQLTSPHPPLTPRFARRKLAGLAGMLIGAVGQDN